MGLEFETERIRRDRELAHKLGVTSGFRRDSGVGSEIELAKMSIPVAAYDVGSQNINHNYCDCCAEKRWKAVQASEARREKERLEQEEKEKQARLDWEQRTQFDKGPVFSEKEKTKISWRL